MNKWRNECVCYKLFNFSSFVTDLLLIFYLGSRYSELLWTITCIWNFSSVLLHWYSIVCSQWVKVNWFLYLLVHVHSIFIFIKYTIFSSPEWKAQGNFSDCYLFVVRLCHKHLTFLSFSLEPLGQFQPILAQSILG